MAGEIADVYLKFEGLTGECNDEDHPGEDGWITIKSFNFGFGFQASDAGTEDDEEDSTSPAGNGAPGDPKAKAPQTRKPKRKKRSAPMKSGPMTFDCISFSKGSDVMSSSLMDACYSGELIPTVELQACRYGGGPDNEKVPFLFLTFKNVHIKTCKLNLATEGLPGEEVEFKYEKVEMRCAWTDNATGNPLNEQPIAVGWDLAAQREPDDIDNDDGG